MTIIRRLFAKRSVDAEHPIAPPQPAEPLAVIGDIHGRADLLDRILDTLDRNHPEARKVFVGDYVDRGPDSRAVLGRLRTLEDAVCLTGNHEEMLLEFLDNPAEGAGRWLRNGGLATLSSYDIALQPDATEQEVVAASQRLAAALTDGTGDWLRARPCHWQSGTVFVTHAGPDPAKPALGQPRSVYTWGYSRFLRESRDDGIWVAHGHWIQPRPTCANSRISVDTGAWTTGKLTAALIPTDGNVTFLSASL